MRFSFPYVAIQKIRLHSFLHLVVGASDGRERPGRTPPLTEPRGRGGIFRRLARSLDNSLLGDALGGVALAVFGLALIIIAGGLS